MVNRLTPAPIIRVSLVSFRRFFLLPITKFISGAFFVSGDVLAFSGSLPHCYIRRRGFYAFTVAE